MTHRELLSRRFEAQRPRLRAIAYRMLGSRAEADDAVQDAWLRLDGADADEIDNLEAWLTTVVARVSLNTLRSRARRREADPHESVAPEPLVGPADHREPEHQALISDSVGLALLVVLETLQPAERLAFVLHDVFGVPFDEIAPMVERTPAATRQLASRARRRVRGEAREPDVALPAQREVVDAFFAAARSGDFDALVAVLHPDAVLRTDRRGTHHGAAAIAGQALFFAGTGREIRPATVNGTAGVVVAAGGRPVTVMAFTVRERRVAAITAIADPAWLAAVDFEAL